MNTDYSSFITDSNHSGTSYIHSKRNPPFWRRVVYFFVFSCT